MSRIILPIRTYEPHFFLIKNNGKKIYHVRILIYEKDKETVYGIYNERLTKSDEYYDLLKKGDIKGLEKELYTKYIVVDNYEVTDDRLIEIINLILDIEKPKLDVNKSKCKPVEKDYYSVSRNSFLGCIQGFHFDKKEKYVTYYDEFLKLIVPIAIILSPSLCTASTVVRLKGDDCYERALYLSLILFGVEDDEDNIIKRKLEITEYKEKDVEELWMIVLTYLGDEDHVPTTYIYFIPHKRLEMFDKELHENLRKRDMKIVFDSNDREVEELRNILDWLDVSHRLTSDSYNYKIKDMIYFDNSS